MTLDQIQAIEQSIETQQRVVQDLSSVVNTAETIARNPGELAEAELHSWLDELDVLLFQQTQVGQILNSSLLKLLLAIIDNPANVNAALTILLTRVVNQLVDKVVSPIAQRALQAANQAAQHAIKQFNDAGGQNLLTSSALTIEKGLTIAGQVMQAADTARGSARLVTDFIELAINDPQAFVGLVLDATGLNDAALTVPTSALSPLRILAWRAQLESAYQAVLGFYDSQSVTWTQLTRIWIRLRSVHEAIEQELTQLRGHVTPGQTDIKRVATSLGRLQALQRDLAAAVLEFDFFLTHLPAPAVAARQAAILSIDSAGSATWVAIADWKSAVDLLRQSILQGVLDYAGAAAARVTTILTALDKLYSLIILSGPALGQVQRIKKIFDSYKNSFSLALQSLPTTVTPDDIPKLVDLVYAATDINGFFSLAAEFLSITGTTLTNVKTARDQLNAAVAQAAGVAQQAKDLYVGLHRAALAAPVILRQALLTEVEKASDAIDAAVQNQANMLLDAAVESLADALTSMGASLTNLLSRVQPSLENLSKLLDVAEQIRNQMTALLSVRSLEISFAWTPEVKEGPGDLGIFEPRPAADSEDDNVPHCQIDSRIKVKIPSADRDISVVGTLRRFKLNLLEKSVPGLFLTVDFRSVQFTSANGSSPNCKVVIRQVSFGGDLAFLEAIQNFLNPTSGPFVELQDNAILAGYRFALPNIDTGGMTIRDARLVLSISIPFDGEPVRFRFGLSDKASPFIVAASLMGGGGWFALGIGVDGLDLIDIGIEMGLAGALAIGPLSAYGRLMVGTFFTKNFQVGTTLGGFVDAFGQASVIGISLVVYTNMTLSYQAQEARGEVQVTIKISLWLVSFELDFDYVRSFSVSSGSRAATSLPAMAVRNNLVGDRTSVADELDWIKYDEALMDA